MRVPGSMSWRISSDLPIDLHFALFVRDSVGLGGGGPAGSQPVPGVLDGGVAMPPLASFASVPERRRAREQWLQWWDALVWRPPPEIDELRALARRGPHIDPRIERTLESIHGSAELRAIVERCIAPAAHWERQRTPATRMAFMRSNHRWILEIGTESQRRTDASGRPPIDAIIDVLMAAGDGATIVSSVRAIVWGDALAAATTRDAIVSAIT